MEKVFILAALVSVARGGVIAAAPAAYAAAPVLARISDATFDPNPAYSFAYDVQDALTGDSKGQVESRANGIVQGQYNVAEPDGTRRIVDYVADPVNGFNAVVRKAPLAVAAPVAHVAAAPLAPAVARIAAPYFGAPAYLGGIVSASAPVVAPVLARFSEDTYDPLPQYTFGYNVQDAITGDSKSQVETRNGNVVFGQYSLNDPDGTRRIVDYASDSINGFNAVVRKAPLALATPVVANVPAVPVVEPVVARAALAPVGQVLEPVVARAAAVPLVASERPLAKTAPTSAEAKAAPPAPAAPAAPLAKAAPAAPAPLAKAAPAAAAPSAKAAPAVVPVGTIRASFLAPPLAFSGLLAPLAYSAW
ncbi:hypothetical protein NQ318_010303 [Aromia moschata]|uniref:Cuticle protein n=1 Tax=Aromia moschata TaxID=1265417 RepID=A0AAV8XSD5_9CUCU|nr:hypothetical protein NQ318_010303 [Aromia moschata]